MDTQTINKKISIVKTDKVPNRVSLPAHLQHLNFDLNYGSYFKLSPKVGLVIAPEKSTVEKIKAGEIPATVHSWLLARKNQKDQWHGYEVELVPAGKNNFKAYVYRSSGNCIAMGKASFESGSIYFSMEFNNRKKPGKRHYLKGSINSNFELQLEKPASVN
jgi:hypothetical protein